ncbi:hypothetical protein Syn7502_02158 [Synechococcus sp. PCC 7502]|uniref:hypothetical protein n=1 Tax=Synechococcus sp. PCC 7502 TaxID=1173263 RepID=UPI00029F936F|nr:hypothetical protein [Synechococcus sp. PCC 7502]AFY74170.1 hypothetical protein Syn7502_02158 [Synechococcus sp. PCC 7502]
MKKHTGNPLIIIGVGGICICLTLIGIWIFLALFLSLWLPTTPPWWTQVRWERLNPVFLVLFISTLFVMLGAKLNTLK